MAPDITVLLPVYNGEKFIAEAVTSILEQSYANFELLVMLSSKSPAFIAVFRRVITEDAEPATIYSPERMDENCD